MEESHGHHKPILLLPEHLAPRPLPTLPSSSAGDSLWGQSFVQRPKFLSLEFPLACPAGLAPFNSGAYLRCSGRLYSGLEMKAALLNAGSV